MATAMGKPVKACGVEQPGASSCDKLREELDRKTVTPAVKLHGPKRGEPATAHSS